MKRSERIFLFACFAVILLLVTLTNYESCGPWPDSHTSPYRLPFPVGRSYNLSQGNCTNGGHRREYKYCYDFAMPIGSEISAAREGVVAAVQTRYEDGDFTVGHENWVKIRHSDGTYAHYSHLTQGGALVTVGEPVVAGQIIAKSGNTGHTGGRPHLHFGIHDGLTPTANGGIPVTFSNALPNPGRLRQDQTYEARP